MTTEQPRLFVSTADFDHLMALLDALPPSEADNTAGLLAELERADVRDADELPPNVVTMYSTVKFSIDSLAKDFEMTLVYPKDMDGRPDQISVLAPVGSALLGLTTGAQIGWPKPGGGTLNIRILDVTRPD